MTNQKRYFAEIMHDVLIVLLVLSMILIAQRINKTIYRIGVLGLAASTFLQIGFGNIPPATKFGRSLKLLGIALGLLFAVFALGILIAPVFIGLTRG
jgi:hypothetical protein